VDREQEGGNHAPSTEQQPQKRCEPSRHLSEQQNPRNDRGYRHPPDVVQARDHLVRNARLTEPDDHRRRNSFEPRNAVQEQGREAHRVKQNETWCLQPADEFCVCGRTVCQCPNLKKREHSKDPDEDAGQLADDEVEIRTVLQPPPERHRATVQPGRAGRATGRAAHFEPHGNNMDLNQSVALAILYSWIAPAGSTFLGHTLVHSPTNVQPHIPSCSFKTAIRSAAP